MRHAQRFLEAEGVGNTLAAEVLHIVERIGFKAGRVGMQQSPKSSPKGSSCVAPCCHPPSQ